METERTQSRNLQDASLACLSKDLRSSTSNRSIADYLANRLARSFTQ